MLREKLQYGGGGALSPPFTSFYQSFYKFLVIALDDERSDNHVAF